MHAPGARFHFGAGAVRSCARGLPFRGTRDCPCVGRAVSIRDPIRIRRGAKPKQGRGATPSIYSAPASRSQAPAQAHAPQRQHATLHAQRYNAVSTPHPVRTILCRARRGSDVALGLSPSRVASLGCASRAGRVGAGPWGWGAAVRPDKFGRISIVYGFEVGSPKFVT